MPRRRRYDAFRIGLGRPYNPMFVHLQTDKLPFREAFTSTSIDDGGAFHFLRASIPRWRIRFPVPAAKRGILYYPVRRDFTPDFGRHWRSTKRSAAVRFFRTISVIFKNLISVYNYDLRFWDPRRLDCGVIFAFICHRDLDDLHNVKFG